MLINTEKKIYTSYFQYFLDKIYLINKIKKNTKIFVRVLKITKNLVIVDGNLKREAYIKISEFCDKCGNIEVKVGDFVEVIIKCLENSFGHIILSRKKFKESNFWYYLKTSFLNKFDIKGFICQKIKGGFNVMVKNRRCFLPFSLTDRRVVCNLPFYLNRNVSFKIMKISFKNRNIILSRKPLIREILKRERIKFLKKIKLGVIIKGIVKNINNKGVYLNTGYMNAFISYKNVSWGPYRYSSETLSINQSVKARVLFINKKRNLYYLGIKQSIKDPWFDIEKRYKIGSIKIAKIFRLSKNFIHIIVGKNLFSTINKNFTINKNKNLNFFKKIKVNSYVKVIVNKINFKKKKIIVDLKYPPLAQRDRAMAF